jgi:Ca-activated chloride channel family protein
MRATRWLLVGTLVLGPWLGTPPSARADEKAQLAALAPQHRQWLEDVALLIGKDERAQFLALAKDYRRDGFIHRFWEARNPSPGSAHNTFKEQWEARVEAARASYGNLKEDRARMLLLHGEPGSVYKTECGMNFWPLEIWHYVVGERLPSDLYLVFYQRGAGGGPYRLWRWADGLGEIIARRVKVEMPPPSRALEWCDQSLIPFEEFARANCGGDYPIVFRAVAATDREDRGALLNQVFASPPPRDVEWLGSFRDVSTDLPAGAAPLPARVEVKFPARDRGRTVVQGLVLVPTAAAAPADLQGHRSYNFLLTGEVLQGSELVESFRYRFDLPAGAAAGGAGDTLPLAFERTLHAGDYVLVLRVEDLHSHHNFRDEQPLTVPPSEALPEVAAKREPPGATAAPEAARAELAPAAGAAGAPGAAAGAGSSAAPARAAARGGDAKAQLAALAPKYRQWLEDVALLIGKEERGQFLALAKDYQRDGFIHRFWDARNPYPGSSHNAFKAQWEARVEAARSTYGSLTEDRARTLLLHGEPGSVYKTDCGMALWPSEVWHYPAGDRLPGDLYLIFYQRGGGGSYALWRRADGFEALVGLNHSNELRSTDSLFAFVRWANTYCVGDSQAVIAAVSTVYHEDDSHLLDHVFVPPPPRDVEWLGSFRGVSTDLPAGTAPLPGTLEVKFPARDRGRTVVQGLVLVPAAAAVPADLEGHRSYNFLLTGEVLQGSELVESFRYRFDLPAAAAGGARDTLPLAFERTLHAGDYVLVLRVEDLHSHHNFRDERPLTVPPSEALPEVATTREAPEVTAVLEGARAELKAAAPAAPASAGAFVRLVPPAGGQQQTGAVRLEAQASGEGIRKVTFFLDGKEMLSRLRPPYTVELNLGSVPRTREVRAAAFGAGGVELASDTLVLNAPQQRFAVRLVEPRAGSQHRREVLARAELHVPDGSSLERLELYLDDQRVATLYQPPYAQLIALPAGGGGARFVRVVAYLAGGGTAEDLAVINSPDVVERLDVRLVELYAAVLDRSGRPVGQLAAGDFKVLEGGEAQTVLRCERVRDLPLHVLLAIDTSASMASSLPQVQKAALSFVQRTLREKDRAALLTFSDSPVLRMPFTGDLGTLAGALAGLNAERGTALFDSLVYGLSYMKGVEHGQSALVLFTDGGDHVSRLGFDEALEFARRSGIAIYAIGAGVPRLDLQVRGRLSKLAEETGGRSFFIDSAAELDGVYATIEDELRSRYLLAYQPKAPPRTGEYRQVEVRVAGDGLRVKTIRGYYP